MTNRISSFILIVFLYAAVHISCAGFPAGETVQPLPEGKTMLPQQFTGTFRWEGVDETQRVVINIYNVSTVSGTITATGKGTYNTAGVVTIINVKISINTATGFFEMWESNPDRESGFVTGGSHTGAISPDLKRIEAVWTTSDSGARGRLDLTAADPGN
ncbi:MAG TPA: hypothetical protein PK514_15000 [Spirochaetota bacterium]|nr:hypothetical protein [Spirochaetota bacterium]